MTPITFQTDRVYSRKYILLVINNIFLKITKLYLLVEVGEDCTAPILDVNSYFKSSIRYSGFYPVANIDAFQESRILVNHWKLYSANRYYHRSTTFGQWTKEKVSILCYIYCCLTKYSLKPAQKTDLFFFSRFSFVFINSGFSNPKNIFVLYLYFIFVTLDSSAKTQTWRLSVKICVYFGVT